jgi:hypothetical protein
MDNIIQSEVELQHFIFLQDLEESIYRVAATGYKSFGEICDEIQEHIDEYNYWNKDQSNYEELHKISLKIIDNLDADDITCENTIVDAIHDYHEKLMEKINPQ